MVKYAGFITPVIARRIFKSVDSIIQVAIGGAGELSSPFVRTVSPPSTPLLLCSLGSALLLPIFTSLEPVLSLLTSPANDESRVGAFHEDMFQAMPVKELICRPLRSHFRHGLPERSRARRPALIAPVLAFGPSRWVETGLGPAMGPFLMDSTVRSMVPSGLCER